MHARLSVQLRVLRHHRGVRPQNALQAGGAGAGRGGGLGGARACPAVFFADDNFVGHRAYAKDLLRALARWNARQGRPLAFYTQASIDMVRDEELLRLLRDANFNEVFIGIETPRKASLAETHKTQNEKVDLVDAVHTIQSHNMFVMAGMIAGFDNDDTAIFDEQYEFCQKAQIPIIMNSTLNASPRTPLASGSRRKAGCWTTTGRKDDFSHQVKPGETNFRPLRMTMDELTQGQKKLIRRLYEPEAFRSASWETWAGFTP